MSEQGGDYWDRLSIIAVKKSRNVSSPAESTELEKAISSGPFSREYRELKTINELIWWCMDAQRDPDRGFKERATIALITAFLNDARDEVKREIDGVVRKTYEV